MRDGIGVCWAPECANAITQSPRGRPQLYCSGKCRVRAVRRNGGSAPTEPFAPLTPLQQDATAATVAVPPDPYPHSAEAAPQVPARTPERAGTHPEPGAEGNSERLTQRPPSAPAATVTQLHLSVTEDSTVPVEIKVHPMVAAYKADVAKLGKANDRQGLQVIEMAEKLVSSATSPAAAANLSKELERLMTALQESSDDALVNLDPSLIIRDRTLAKLRGIQDAAAEASA